MTNYAELTIWNKVPAFSTIFNGVTLFGSLGISAQDLYNIFIDKYAIRLLYKPYASDSAQDNATASRIAAIVSRFTKMYQYKYSTLVSTIGLDYDPIQNYSMTETAHDTRTPNLQKSETATRTGDDTRTISNTEKNTGTETRGVDTTDTATTSGADIHGVTTFDNVATYANADKTDHTSNATTTTNSTDTLTLDTNSINSASDKLTHNTTDTTTAAETGTETTERTLTRQGNIGVTTSQQMIQSERNIADFSPVDIYLQDIANLICLSIY